MTLSDIGRRKPHRTDAGLFVTDEKLKELPTKLLKLLNQTAGPEHLSVPLLAEKIGLPFATIRTMMNPKTQKAAKGLNLDDLSKIVKFARRYAESLEDRHRGEFIIEYCNDMARRVQDSLEIGGLSLTETAFVTNLKLDDRAQQIFSNRHAGVYALIRLDRDEHILISRMDVFPRETQLCRFRTDKKGLGFLDPPVEGYIYSIGREIQAVGRPSSASPLRTSILHSRGLPESEHGGDMIGLRLGISDFDGGPFAYRIYCRQIAGIDQLDQDMPEWADLFGVRRHGQAEGVERMIPDVRDILRLFNEQDPFTPWGVRMPTGVPEQASS